MVKFRIKTKIMAVVTFFVISAAVILGGYDMQNAEATGGTDYVKYTYATGQTQTYNLPEIPTINYATYAMQAASYAITDTRETYYDSAVVQVNLHDYINPDNHSAGTFWNYGTGFIISDHEIMTAAHVIYNNTDGFNDYVKIKVPNSDGNIDELIVINVTAAHVPQSYINLMNNPTGQGGQDLDYAILTVEEDLSSYGCYLLGMGTDSIKQKNVPIHSLGYAGSNLKISHGLVFNSNDVSYDFDIYSTHGSSGGPIYVESSFGVPGTSNEDYQVKTYRTAISLVHGPGGDENIVTGIRIRPIIMQFAYDNDYL